MTRTFAFLFLLLVISYVTVAQTLKPGFSADEYATVLRVSAKHVDAQYRGKSAEETNYTRVYRSAEVGLHNRWDLWLNKERNTLLVSIRGTTSDMDSWLANFYSAMIPATGTLVLDSNRTFPYKLSTDPRAAVHVGWTIGMASLAPDIERKIREYYAQGIKQVIVAGHSQGGAIAFLTTSYLHYRIADGALPADLVLKTYSSATPKPGNLYYAYDYDFITRGGWAFRVVNSADWVPETPFSIQTISDMNATNPFIHTNEMLSGQKWVVRTYLRHVYRQLTHRSRRAERTFEKYMGKMAYKQVKRYLPNLQQPIYVHSCNFMPAGTPIILQADAAYYQQFPDTGGNNVFRHHLFDPYNYLLQRYYQ